MYALVVKRTSHDFAEIEFQVRVLTRVLAAYAVSLNLRLPS